VRPGRFGLGLALVLVKLILDKLPGGAVQALGDCP
jgi:hypothetical protein